jgi:hypothetical protein
LDIENLLAVNRGQLDLDLIRREWQTVADVADPRWRRFDEMVVHVYLPPGQEGSAPNAGVSGA